MELWQEVDRVARRALDSGHLQPIATRVEVIVDGPITFQVRVLEHLQRKLDHTADQRRKRRNPFLPPQPELTVGPVSDTHVAVLNKFNVMARHLLLVTRRFVHQDEPLASDDFAAMTWCLAQGEALVFYNGGEVAGASQPHRHLQAVPLPWDGVECDGLPVDRAIGLEREGVAPDLQFRHLVRRWSGTSDWRSESTMGQTFRDMAAHLGIGPKCPGYNLLVTRRWMMVVPRPRECALGMSVNALGFAGSLLVRDETGLERLASFGPRRALCEVTDSRTESR
jgi:ATP adenylyltransferase